MSAAPTVDGLMASTLNVRGRDPRSAEYMAGVRALLAFRIDGDGEMPYPYPFGTVQSDAYLSGMCEGDVIWKAAKKSTPSPAGAVRTVTLATDHLDAIAEALNGRIMELKPLVTHAAMDCPSDLTWADALDVARQALALVEAA